MAQALQAAQVTKRFGPVTALDGVDLAIRKGEVLTLLGPSGSGKTTLLRVIAGFETPDSGSVHLGERDITEDPPAHRDIGMVFQNYALFPHMTVADNVGFPLRMRRRPKGEIARRVGEVLAQVELGGYGGRYPNQLSGGQQQRVALARAIVFDPPLLLLDEPFGALDRKLRETMQLELRRLQQRLGLTTLFVTHDQEEALILSDRIAVMRSGQIEQLGRPAEIYQSPRSWFVADFIGESNLLRGTVRSVESSVATLVLPTGETLRVAAPGVAQGTHGILVRPERIRRLGPGDAADNSVEMDVVETIYLGQSIKHRLRAKSGLELTVRWPGTADAEGLPIDARVTLGWQAADARLLVVD